MNLIQWYLILEKVRIFNSIKRMFIEQGNSKEVI
jgi:hypothetical protein